MIIITFHVTKLQSDTWVCLTMDIPAFPPLMGICIKYINIYIYISIRKNGESFFDPNNIFVLIPLPFDAIVIAKIMINQ